MWRTDGLTDPVGGNRIDSITLRFVQMWRLYFALFFTFTAPFAVHAQTVNGPSKTVSPLKAMMKGEGDAFLGIPFAEAFPGEIVPCPTMTGINLPNRDVIKTMGEPCFFQKAANKFDLLNGPNLGLGHTLEIITYKGYPALFKLEIARSQFLQMTQLFSTKYGPAQLIEEYPARTKAGETFQFQSLHWKGQKMAILLEEGGSGDNRWSVALVTSRLAEKLRDADEKLAIEAAAGNL